MLQFLFRDTSRVHLTHTRARTHTLSQLQTHTHTHTLTHARARTHTHSHARAHTHKHTNSEIHTCVRREYIYNPPYRLDILILFPGSKFTSQHFVVFCLALSSSTLLLAIYFHAFPKLRLPFLYKYSKLNCITD